MNSLPILELAAPSANVSPDDAHFGALTSSRGCLPLRAMDVRARIDGLMAETALSQTFVNTFDEPIEATYIFPLPDRAAVVHFEMIVGGRVVEGILKERGAARKAYRQAVSEGKRAAITEEERPGVFTLRVGNLMPGDEAVVVLRLVGPLPYADGEATFRFPLVVAPRYMPGKPISGPSVGPGTAVDTDAVPDASRISPPVLLAGYPNPVALSMSVDLSADGLAITDLRSSLHAVREEENGDGTCRVRVYPGERLDRDFILRYRLGGKGVQTSLVVTPDQAGASEGSFMLTLLPPAESETAQRPRDIVFVLDRSGSMGGWKMVAARRALARMIETLAEADRFTVYAFDDSIELPPGFPASGVLAATDRNRFRASEFLAKVESRGGTEMAQPLGRAVDVLQRGSAERDRVLVLLTDGQVGNEDQVLQHIGNSLRGLRVFTLGIDMAVNEAFLKRLALLGGGACDVVESEARLDAVMDKVHRRIGTAVCTGLTVRADSGWVVDGDSMVPGRLPDLFVGAPVLVLGRYRGEHPGAVVVECRDAADRPWAQRVEGRPVTGRSVACAWARGRVRELEDKYVTGQGDKKWLERTIVETSLRFGVLCRFTSYVAVDRVVANTSGTMQPVVQAVEKPAGWNKAKAPEGVPLAGAPPALMAAPAATPQLRDMMRAAPPAVAAASQGKSLPPAQSQEKQAEDQEQLRKRMLAQQILQTRPANEDDQTSRVSKKTQLAIDSLLLDLANTSADATPPAAAAPPPVAKRDEASDEVEFELTLDDGPNANSGARALRAKLAGATPDESVFGEKGSEDKDIFETDFEVPAIDEGSVSQAVGAGESDTDLESSEFDLAADASEEAPVEILAEFSEEESLEEEENEADDSAVLYRSMPAPKKPTPPAPRGPAETAGSSPPKKGSIRKSIRRLDFPAKAVKQASGESLWDKVKRAADGVRKALTPSANERQEKPASQPNCRAIPTPPAQKPPAVVTGAAPRQEAGGPPSFDLSSYRARAHGLAHDLTRNMPPDDAARLHRLGILAVKLAELVEDLRSVGVPDAECQPLAQTVVFLKSFVGRAVVSTEEVAEAVANAEKALRNFAGAGKVVSTAPVMVAATPPGREAFWK